MIGACLLLGSPGRATSQEADEAAAPAPAAAEATSKVESEIESLAALEREWAARSAELAGVRESAPEVLAELDAELATLARGDVPDIAPDRPLAEIETELLAVEQDLALERRSAATLATEAAGRAERRKQIPDLLAAARERLFALEGASAPPAGESVGVELRQRAARVRRAALEREIEAYEEELRSYEVRGQLLAKRRERTALRIDSLDARQGALRAALTARRQGEAEVAAEESERLLDSAGAMPAVVLETVQRIADQNRELAARRTGEDGLLQKIEDVSGKRARAAAQIAELTAELEFLRSHAEAGGLSGAVGVALRKARAEAPEIGKYQRFIRMRRDQIDEVQLEQVELLEQRQALRDVEKVVAEKMAEFQSVLSPEDHASVEELLRHLIETQQRHFDALIADNETYFEQLVDFDAVQRELVSRSESLLQFIDERILWIPSGKPLPPAPTGDLWEAFTWFFEPRFVGQLVGAVNSTLASEPLTSAGVVLLLFGAPLAWPRMRSRIAALGREASHPSCLRLKPTGIALGLTLLLAAWGPGLLAFVGWRLGVSLEATQYVRAIAHGALLAAFVWATVHVSRQLLRSGGIAVAHLGWPEEPSRSLRRHLAWFAAVTVPAVFVIGVFEQRGEGSWNEAVGRAALLVILGAIGVLNHRVLRERGGALPRLIEAQSGSAIPAWARGLLHAASVFVPFVLAVAVFRGYYWTALQLATSLHLTFAFLLLLVFAQQLGARCFLIASRRLALRRWEKAEIARAERTAANPDAPEPALSDSEVELATVDEHTHRVLRNAAVIAALVGVWMIWADLFPVAGLLRSVDLWETTVTVTVEMKNAAGERITSVEDRLVPVTLADLFLALMIAIATLAIVRNLPGLLEVSVFRQLRTSAGERYAYATIATYAVTVAGAAMALKAVGVGWASIQWLVAAVGLGLGFGLQEIFANFISGLIILFERPIRVGDTVTVGDVSGTVSKIRIRATWITGFDRKELVVPNKEFITSRLVNWSLSDAVLRVEIPVGIAYGSDTEKASRVLKEVAERNEHVLDEPPPYVLFRGFGDSSLNFELRAFSPDVSHYLQIVHEVHMAIDRAFRAEGIEIAFPQRDLHVRSVPEPRGVSVEGSIE